jgi:hypothetical protein
MERIVNSIRIVKNLLTKYFSCWHQIDEQVSTIILCQILAVIQRKKLTRVATLLPFDCC